MTTCRTRRHRLVVPEPGERRVQVVDLAQAREAESEGGALARRPARGVLPVDEPVGCTGVDDEQRQAGPVQVERHLLGATVTAVQQQRVLGGAPQRRRLVHPAGRRAGDLVLGAHARCRQCGAAGVVGGQPGQLGGGHATAHSSAADEDRPDPTGTSSRTATSMPGRSAPSRVSAHSTPAT